MHMFGEWVGGKCGRLAGPRAGLEREERKLCSSATSPGSKSDECRECGCERASVVRHEASRSYMLSGALQGECDYGARITTQGQADIEVGERR
jgi:hypothetical protein